MTEQKFKDTKGWFEINPKTGLEIHIMLRGGWCIKDRYAKFGEHVICEGSFEKCYEYYTTQKSQHAA